MNTIERPSAAEFAPYYADYVSRVPDGNIVQLLAQQKVTLRARTAIITPAQETYRYAPGKWTVREMFGHLTDVERVFGYRAMCISRGDTASLPGFDENTYVETANFNSRPLQALLDELVAVRDGNLLMMHTFDAEAWARMGVANNVPVSVRALAFIMAGHINHHLEVLRTRYAL